MLMPLESSEDEESVDLSELERMDGDDEEEHVRNIDEITPAQTQPFSQASTKSPSPLLRPQRPNSQPSLEIVSETPKTATSTAVVSVVPTTQNANSKIVQQTSPVLGTSKLLKLEDTSSGAQLYSVKQAEKSSRTQAARSSNGISRCDRTKMLETTQLTQNDSSKWKQKAVSSCVNEKHISRLSKAFQKSSTDELSSSETVKKSSPNDNSSRKVKTIMSEPPKEPKPSTLISASVQLSTAPSKKKKVKANVNVKSMDLSQGVNRCARLEMQSTAPTVDSDSNPEHPERYQRKVCTEVSQPFVKNDNPTVPALSIGSSSSSSESLGTSAICSARKLTAKDLRGLGGQNGVSSAFRTECEILEGTSLRAKVGLRDSENSSIAAAPRTKRSRSPTSEQIIESDAPWVSAKTLPAHFRESERPLAKSAEHEQVDTRRHTALKTALPKSDNSSSEAEKTPDLVTATANVEDCALKSKLASQTALSAPKNRGKNIHFSAQFQANIIREKKSHGSYPQYPEEIKQSHQQDGTETEPGKNPAGVAVLRKVNAIPSKKSGSCKEVASPSRRVNDPSTNLTGALDVCVSPNLVTKANFRPRKRMKVSAELSRSCSSSDENSLQEPNTTVLPSPAHNDVTPSTVQSLPAEKPQNLHIQECSNSFAPGDRSTAPDQPSTLATAQIPTINSAARANGCINDNQDFSSVRSIPIALQAVVKLCFEVESASAFAEWNASMQKAQRVFTDRMTNAYNNALIKALEIVGSGLPGDPSVPIGKVSSNDESQPVTFDARLCASRGGNELDLVTPANGVGSQRCQQASVTRERKNTVVVDAGAKDLKQSNPQTVLQGGCGPGQSVTVSGEGSSSRMPGGDDRGVEIRRKTKSQLSSVNLSQIETVKSGLNASDQQSKVHSVDHPALADNLKRDRAVHQILRTLTVDGTGQTAVELAGKIGRQTRTVNVQLRRLLALGKVKVIKSEDGMTGSVDRFLLTKTK